MMQDKLNTYNKQMSNIYKSVNKTPELVLDSNMTCDTEILRNSTTPASFPYREEIEQKEKYIKYLRFDKCN